MKTEQPILILEEGLGSPQRWLLEKDELRIGRWPDNDIVLPDRLVSRYHTLIRRVGTQLILADCQSTNGTFVNGTRIRAEYPLQDGDRIQIAPNFQFRFVDSASTDPISSIVPSPRLTLDEAECRVLIGEAVVDLSAVQYALLRFLIQNAQRVVSRAEIVQAIWADEVASGVTNQAVDALVRRLRERLAEVDPAHQYVRTVRGHGFRFENRPPPV